LSTQHRKKTRLNVQARQSCISQISFVNDGLCFESSGCSSEVRQAIFLRLDFPLLLLECIQHLFRPKNRKLEDERSGWEVLDIA